MKGIEIPIIYDYSEYTTDIFNTKVNAREIYKVVHPIVYPIPYFDRPYVWRCTFVSEYKRKSV